MSGRGFVRAVRTIDLGRRINRKMEPVLIIMLIFVLEGPVIGFFLASAGVYLITYNKKEWRILWLRLFGITILVFWLVLALLLLLFYILIYYGG
jgi:hypothetical protein